MSGKVESEVDMRVLTLRFIFKSICSRSAVNCFPQIMKIYWRAEDEEAFNVNDS